MVVITKNQKDMSVIIKEITKAINKATITFKELAITFDVAAKAIKIMEENYEN